MAEFPSVSVVIPTYHWKPEQVLMSTKCIVLAETNTEVPFTKVIVETCSNHLEDFADKFIYEKERTTSTKSMNKAFSICDTEYTVLLTNDVFVSDGWLEALLEPFHVKQDCGISTLASSQFGHVKKNTIEEGNWFSIACWKTEGPIFDERYPMVWDDTDFIYRKYLDGKRMYRNFSCVVDHLVGATHYSNPGHNERYEEGRKIFLEKYKGHDNKFFKELAGI